MLTQHLAEADVMASNPTMHVSHKAQKALTASALTFYSSLYLASVLTLEINADIHYTICYLHDKVTIYTECKS